MAGKRRMLVPIAVSQHEAPSTASGGRLTTDPERLSTTDCFRALRRKVLT